MKRTLPIILLPLMMLVAACSPEPGTDSQLYDRYRQRADLTVAQVEGFRLNDSVKVDVLILVADDAAAWDSLRQEFNIRTTEGVTSWLGTAGDPVHRIQWTDGPCCKAIASHASRTLCLYSLRDRTDYDSLLEYQIDGLRIEN